MCCIYEMTKLQNRLIGLYENWHVYEYFLWVIFLNGAIGSAETCERVERLKGQLENNKMFAVQ